MTDELKVKFDKDKAVTDWVVQLSTVGSTHTTSTTFKTRQEARDWKKELLHIHDRLDIKLDKVTIFRRKTEVWYPDHRNMPSTMFTLQVIR